MPTGLSVGDIVADRYKLIEVLGDSPTRCAYRAFDSEVEVEVALWAMKPELFPTDADKAAFIAAADKASSVRHRHLLRIFEAGTVPVGNGELLFLTQQLGTTAELEDRLSSGGKADASTILRYAESLAAALDAIHGGGLHHGWLCPADVVEVAGQVKLCGAGVLVGMPRDVALASWGAQTRYLAPELVATGDCNPACDWYGLGVLLLELATGEPARSVDTAVASLSAVSSEQADALSLVLASKPENRIGLALPFVSALKRAWGLPAGTTSDNCSSGNLERLAEANLSTTQDRGPRFGDDGLPVGAAAHRPEEGFLVSEVDEPTPRGETMERGYLASDSSAPAKTLKGYQERGAGKRGASLAKAALSQPATDFAEEPTVTGKGLGKIAKAEATEPEKVAIEHETLAPSKVPLRESAYDAADTISADSPSMDDDSNPMAGFDEDATVVDLAPGPRLLALSMKPSTEPGARPPKRTPYVATAAKPVIRPLSSLADAAEIQRDLGKLAPPRRGPQRTTAGLRWSTVGLVLVAGAAALAVILMIVAPDPKMALVDAVDAGIVIDARRAKAQTVLILRPTCPDGTVHLAPNNLCVDAHEAPGKGRQPQSGISNDDARKSCVARGMRLCTAAEWESACMGAGGSRWPYGRRYKPEICNVESQTIDLAGSHPECRSSFAIYDMAGNMAEWVEEGEIRGGSAIDESTGRCSDVRKRVPIQSAFSDVGFRCCADAIASPPPSD